MYKYWKYSQERLTRLCVKIVPEVMAMYNQSHRFYHTWDHIEDLLSQLEKKNLLENDVLFLATVFHDIIYNPRKNDNEDKSAEVFSSCYNGELKEEVIKIILDTKNHKPSNDNSKIFCEMDLDILRRPFCELMDYENKIFKEYQFADWKLYKTKRLEALEQLQKFCKFDVRFKDNNELDLLIKYIECRKPNIGVYAGSFNPMTKGHLNILEKAEDIFDKVIIARGKNPDKNNELKELPKEIQFRQIEEYDGLLTDFIQTLGYDITLIRGLRNATDLQYEITQYRFMQDLHPHLKVVSLFCDKEYEHISSSAIRTLEKYGKGEKYKI